MRRRPGSATVVAVVVATAFAGGCGGDEPSARELGRTFGERLAAADDRGGEACALLTPAEIAEELGGPVTAGVPAGVGCRFDVGEDQAELGSGALAVELPLLSSGVEPAVWFESLRPFMGADPVDGVGDGAFYEPADAKLTVIVGEVVFTVRASIIPEPTDLVDRLGSLAAVAADRIDT